MIKMDKEFVFPTPTQEEIKKALNGGTLSIYSGSMPGDPAATLVATFHLFDGVFYKELTTGQMMIV